MKHVKMTAIILVVASIFSGCAFSYNAPQTSDENDYTLPFETTVTNIAEDNPDYTELAEPEETEHTHNYSCELVEATCTDGGHTVYTCDACGDSYTDDETTAVGHNYTQTVVEPTYESVGYTQHICSICGFSYTDNETAKLSYPITESNSLSSYVICDVEPHTMYASTSLNLRTGPSTNFQRVTTISLNTAVLVIGEVDNGWVKVVFEDAEYYCSGAYLLSEKKEIVSQISSSDICYGPITGDPGADTSIVSAANNYWYNYVPAWLRQVFLDSGWNITVSGTSLKERFGYSFSIIGLTVYDEQTIYLDNRSGAINNALIHELGHFIDCYYGFPSVNPEFEEIFASEKCNYTDISGVGDGHHVSNSMEYFASVFQDIIISGAGSLGDIPMTYEYVSRYIG